MIFIFRLATYIQSRKMLSMMFESLMTCECVMSLTVFFVSFSYTPTHRYTYLHLTRACTHTHMLTTMFAFFHEVRIHVARMVECWTLIQQVIDWSLHSSSRSKTNFSVAKLLTACFLLGMGTLILTPRNMVGISVHFYMSKEILKCH